MTKKKFIKIIQDYINYLEYEDKLDQLGVKIWETKEISNLAMNYLDMIADMCHLPYNDLYGDDITYFLYDCECGKNADALYIMDDEGTKYHLHTVEDLWNYIVKMHPEIEETDGQ